MSRQHGKRAARGGGAVGLLAAASLILGTAVTYAYWTSGATSASALEASAGTLAVDLTRAADVTDLTPGETKIRYFTVSNTGSLSTKYKMTAQATDIDASGSGAGQLFASGLQIGFGINSVTFTPCATVSQANTPVTCTTELTLQAGQSHTWRLTGSLPATSDNMADAAGDKSTLSITVNGQQAVTS